MKLYYSPGACSLAPHILLAEAGAQYAAEAVDLRTHQASGGTDFYKVNPKGYVPTLALDNGEILTENAVILQYISDQKPERGLMPKPGTLERYRSQEWLNFIATELHKGFAPLFNPQTPADYKPLVKANLAKKLQLLETGFKGQNFLAGANFSAPDAYLFTILTWAPKLDVDLTPFPALCAYVERVKSRPAVQETMKAEGLPH